MIKLLKILLLQLIVICHNISYGQSLVRSSLSSIGSTYSDDGFILRQTIAQPSNTLVGSNGGFVLRQGFQQPLNSRIIPNSNTTIDFSLYPNPAYEKTLLEFKEEIQPYSVTISNINGRVLTKLNDQKLMSNWLDLKNLTPGIYFVTVVSERKTGSKKLIVKH